MLISSAVFCIGLALPIQAPGPKEAPKPVQATIEDILSHALKTHPEILAAEAKLAGAKAELELAKLALSQRILKAKNRYDVAQAMLAAADQELANSERLSRGNVISATDLAIARSKNAVARSQLADAEAEWKAFQPGAGPAKETTTGIGSGEPSSAEKEQYKILTQTIRIKNADKVDLVEATKLMQSLPEMKGLNLRVPAWSSKSNLKNPPLIELREGEISVAGWLQLIVDEFNSQSSGLVPHPQVPPTDTGTYDWYVREYGLIFERVDNKPVGAPSLTEFLKSMRGAPGPKK